MKASPIVCALSLAAMGTVPAGAQLLDGWSLLHSDSAFDYLATERDLVRSGPGVFRVVTSRMLVRFIDGTREDLAMARLRSGRDSTGYHRFVSGTYLVDVSCDRRRVATVETVDFHEDGLVLSRRADPAPGWAPSVEDWPQRASDRLIVWACAGRGTSDVP